MTAAMILLTLVEVMDANWMTRQTLLSLQMADTGVGVAIPTTDLVPLVVTAKVVTLAELPHTRVVPGDLTPLPVTTQPPLT